jgi:uncharacterized membrane protein
MKRHNAPTRRPAANLKRPQPGPSPDAQEMAIRRVITAGLLVAITLLLAMTPIGFIRVPTPGEAATTLQIPAIIGGILAGPLVGLIVSIGFGVGSLISPYLGLKDPLIVFIPRFFVGVAAAYTYLGLRRAKRGILLSILLAFIVIAAISPFLLLYSAEIASALGVELTEVQLASVEISQFGAIMLFLAAAAIVAGGILAFRWARSEEVAVVAVGAAAVVGSLSNTVLVLSAAMLREYLVLPPALLIGVTHGVPEAVVSAAVTVAVVTALIPVRARQRGSRI